MKFMRGDPAVAAAAKSGSLTDKRVVFVDFTQFPIPSHWHIYGISINSKAPPKTLQMIITTP